MNRMAIIGLGVLLSCGARRLEDGSARLNPYLLKVGQSRRLLTTEKRFISYAPPHGRVSLIAPEVPREVFFAIRPGFDQAVPLPNFDGVGLWNETDLLLLEGVASRSFRLPGNTDSGQAASGSLTFIFRQEAGASFRVIRALGDSAWQEEDVTPVWINPDQPGTEIEFSLASSGSRLLMFDKAGTHYAWLKAKSSGERLQAEGTVCTGLPLLDEDTQITSLGWSGDDSKVLLGSRQGMLYGLMPDVDCPSQAALPSLALPQQDLVLSVSTEATGTFLVTQPYSISRVQWLEGSLLVSKSIKTSCQIPVGALALDGSRLVLACLYSENNVDNREIEDDLPLQNRLDYLVVNEEGEEEVRITMQESRIAGVAVDTERKRLYVMSPSALGIMQSYDLLSGQVEHFTGLFIDGLLNRKE